MSVKLYIRKNTGETKISIRYRPNRNTNIVLVTPFTIEAERWNKEKEIYNESFKKKNPRTDSEKHLNRFIDQFNIKLNEFKLSLNGFIINNNYKVDSIKLKDFIEHNYSKKDKKTCYKKIPQSVMMSKLIEDYIEDKSLFSLGKHKKLTIASINKFNVIKNKLNKINSKLSVSDVDDKFRNQFTEWCTKNRYSPTTIVKELKIIKTFIKYAKSKKYKTSDDVGFWSFYLESRNFKDPILTLGEIQKISSLYLEYEYLENARDWLVIGCYIGLRVSDLLRLDRSNIIDENFVTLVQKKTKDPATAILLEPVKQILNKRDGEFPRKISDQKFNDYIKIICKLARINELIEGGKMIDKRKVFGKYEKWELVTSHICRRSFVTNFRPIFGDEGIKINTGHKTSSMVEHYDQNSLLDKAKNMRLQITEKLNTI